MSRRWIGVLFSFAAAGVLTYLLLAPRTTETTAAEGSNHTTVKTTRWGLLGYRVERAESSFPSGDADASKPRVVFGQFRLSNEAESSQWWFAASVALVVVLWVAVALAVVLAWRRRRAEPAAAADRRGTTAFPDV